MSITYFFSRQTAILLVCLQLRFKATVKRDMFMTMEEWHISKLFKKKNTKQFMVKMESKFVYIMTLMTCH